VGFAIYGADPYVTFNRAESRSVPPRADAPWQYPLLVAHVFAGVVTICLAWIQVWPWLRTHHPRAHRRIGWVFLMAGAFPAGLLSFPVAIVSTAGQSFRLSLLTLAVLWLAATVLGFVAGLQRRLGDHRKWMLRNVALATVVITARPVSYANLYLMHGLFPHTYPLGYLAVAQMKSLGIWFSIVLHLVIVEWFVLGRRRSRRPTATRKRVAADLAG
jgi:hypothetical protein